jgi:phosphatidylinositol kinase/protein kinase (PI-3  family)
VAGEDAVTVEGVGPLVLPLATKTRPKKVVLAGSDGRQRAFLLKGREDLRMDERLMQVGGGAWGHVCVS